MTGFLEDYNQSINKNYCIFIEDFLENFKPLELSVLKEGYSIKNKIPIENQNKIIPLIQLAKVNEADEIVNIIDEIYRGTYPYKEFCDIEEIKKMIEDERYHFILFKIREDKEIAGFYNAQLDFENKRGYLGRLVLKKKYHTKIDLVKSAKISISTLYYSFRDKIYIWYGETRTAHAKSQYITSQCGVKPIAFFPNKDIFLNQIESDLMQIIYNKKAIETLRSKEIPKLIPQVSNCFLYTTLRYNLGPVNFKNPLLRLDSEKYLKSRRNMIIKSESNKFGYEWVNMFNPRTHSYFKFLLTRHLFNIEKIEYKIKYYEELVAFIHELKELMKRKYIRYCECFVSGYKPKDQKIFFIEGFIPRGYIPSWFYNKDENVFEDAIVFNLFKGKLSKNLKLIPEGKELVKILEI